MPKGKKNKWKARSPSTVKISINRSRPHDYVNPICSYISANYGHFEVLEQFSYDDGGLCIVLEMRDIHTAVKASQENPHFVNGLRFAIRHDYQPPSGQGDLRPSSQQQPKESEGERIESTVPALGDMNNLQKQMQYVYQVLALTDQDHSTRQEFIRRFEERCRSALGYECHLYAFGSSVNRLGMKNCDLDLVLLTNGVIEQVWAGPLPDVRNILRTIKGMMYREQYNFGISKIVVIPQARVPVIKFYHDPTLMECDISFNKRTGVLNTRLISQIMEYSESARLLSFSIRLWGKQKNFVGGGGQKINSYTITLMTIFYLQQQGIIPALKLLRTQENTLADAETDVIVFVTDLKDFSRFQLPQQQSLGSLLLGFIKYYIRFPYEAQVISVLEGTPISCDDIPFNTKSLNVQDPFELSYNTAKGVQENMVWWFKSCLMDAWNYPSLLNTSSDRNMWGLQFLFQAQEMPKRSKNNAKSPAANNKESNQSHGQASSSQEEEEPTKSDSNLISDSSSGIPLSFSTTTSIIPKGRGKYLTLDIDIPINESSKQSNVSRYLDVCCSLCDELRTSFHMEVEVSLTNHPLSKHVNKTQHTNRNKRRSKDHTTESREFKRQKTDEYADTLKASEAEKPVAPQVIDLTSDPTDTAERQLPSHAETNPQVVDLTSDTTDTAAMMSEADVYSNPDDIPIRYFSPYTIRARSKCNIYHSLDDLNDMFDYDKCLEKMATALEKEKQKNPVQVKVDFTVTFHPKDSRFTSIHLEIHDLSCQRFESVYAYMAKLLPPSVMRRFGSQTATVG